MWIEWAITDGQRWHGCINLRNESQGGAGERNSLALQTLHFLVQEEKKTTSLLLTGTFNIGQS
jgi:hypothetical protein